ncbi:MAG: hypothetical protein ACETWK_00420 [Candidatus Aminicenantaceae bacterium]
MLNDNDILRKSAFLIKEIEKQLESALSKKKEEIEKELEEKLKRERELAQKKLNTINEELEKEKKILKDYRSEIAEYESHKSDLKEKLNTHLDKALQYQSDIEKLVGSTLEELKVIKELSESFEVLDKEAEKKAAFLQKELKEKFGIEAEAIDIKEEDEKEQASLEKELTKLRKIKELLGNASGVSEALKTEEAEEEEEPELREDISGIMREEEEDLEIPELDEVMKAAPPEEPKEAEVAKEEVRPEEKEEEKEQKKELEPEVPSEEEPRQEEEVVTGDLDEMLDKYRKTEAIEGSGKIDYYQRKNKIIIDGDTLISSINNQIEQAERLYEGLSKSDSAKDKFFLTQDIINNQENLRKLVLKCIRKCEHESCSLPQYTANILSVQTLKVLLEKLSMQNWGNEDEFKSFISHFESLSREFLAKITPSGSYYRSIIQELRQA